MLRHYAQLAQLVEQRTENPCVPGSIPGGTTFQKQSECSAVGSALRSGRRGRAFESPHPDLIKRSNSHELLRFLFPPSRREEFETTRQNRNLGSNNGLGLG